MGEKGGVGGGRRVKGENGGMKGSDKWEKRDTMGWMREKRENGRENELGCLWLNFDDFLIRRFG